MKNQAVNNNSMQHSLLRDIFSHRMGRGCLWVVFAFLSCSASAVEPSFLYQSEFNVPAGELRETDEWTGKDEAIVLNGKGMACPASGKADGFAKRPLDLPSGLTRIRLSARVVVSALPGSDTQLHHIPGEKPAWLAIGFGSDSNPQSGLARASLVTIISRHDGKILLGLGENAGSAAPAMGTAETDAANPLELELDYRFSDSTATVSLAGQEILRAVKSLKPEDFRVLLFQLRRMQSATDPQTGGIQSIRVEAWADGTKAAPALKTATPAAPPEPLGSRPNSEALRARELDEHLEKARTPEETLAVLREGFANPPSTYRPHTRWWWPGNALTPEIIDWQLEQMKEQGFGGTEPMAWMKVYEKGNVEFESPEFIGLMKHAVDKSRELGMFITPPLFPGWNHGSSEVRELHRSKALVISAVDTEGGAIQCKVPLPAPDQIQGLKWSSYMAGEKKKFEALVAVGLGKDGQPDATRRIDLTASVTGNRSYAAKPSLTVNAQLPPGRWRLMAFWTCFTGQKCACENFVPETKLVDHLDQEAVRAYLAHSGGRYIASFAGDFGQTVDSFFGDSYEVQQDFSYWSDGMFERFQKEKGYDLRPYLPLLIQDGAPETSRVRYDFGHFLHLMGMEGMTRPLTEYCDELGIHMRQQPHYRFTTELIEAAGTFQRPETENTKRSFDPMFWHKLTTSGAALYPSKNKRWVSSEAFTFINQNYRATMEEIKRATDLFLRDGITQFYNHGYYASPEREIAPSRDLIYMNRISHVNTWWPWFRGLADYQARAAFLSRQGRAEADVLVYSPMPTLWSERAEYPCSHVRDVPFGPLPKILVANGYDFDCVNDDLLLNHAKVEKGKLVINGYDYSVLILPRAICLAPEILEKLSGFVEQGGAVLALGRLPEYSPGMANHEKRDADLRALCAKLFDEKGGNKTTGSGMTAFFPGVEGLEYLQNWSPGALEWEPTPPLSPAWKGFIETLRSRLTPDFEIAGQPQSDGLTFRHTRVGSVEVWFLTNLSPNPINADVTLNSPAKLVPQAWDALTGTITSVPGHSASPDGRMVLPVSLEPWASMFYLLAPEGSGEAPAPKPASKASTTLALEGPWKVDFKGLGGFTTNRTLETLADWTTLPELKNFSGNGTYRMDFDWKPEPSEARQTALGSPNGESSSQSKNLKPETSVILDLGTVHEVAAVKVNGLNAGKLWMQPYRVDISKLVKPGNNTLEVTVANSMWNYCAGLKEPTPIPQELRARYGEKERPVYKAWENFLRWRQRESLMPSGLLGPVTLQTAVEIPIKPQQ